MIETPELLDFGSDRALRFAWFGRESYGHMAKLHLGYLQWLLDAYTAPGETVGDPMAGSGSLLIAAAQQRNVILREIEPRYLALCHRHAARVLDRAGLFAAAIDIGQADARERWGWVADHLLFSPPYGCDAQRRLSRTHQTLTNRLLRLGREKTHYSKRWEQLARAGETEPGAAGLFAFAYGSHPAQLGHLRGTAYWREMEKVYVQAHAATRPGGLMILVLKNHVRKGQIVPVVEETEQLCARLGFRFRDRHARRVYPLSLWQRRRKERGELVVEEEYALIFER